MSAITGGRRWRWPGAYSRRGARLFTALVVLVVLGGVAAGVVGRVRGHGGPPATGAQKLVPAGALAFLSLSTDRDRTAVRDAADLGERFDAFERLRGELAQRLSGTQAPVNAEQDVAPWIGKEAAIALLDTGTGTAGSLVVVDVRDEGKARAFLGRNEQDPIRKTYKGVRVDRYGEVSTAFVGRRLLIGQDPTVQAGIDRAQGRGTTLDGDPTFQRAVTDLPEGRVATAYASADGLHRLLEPQGGVLGTLAGLLDQPGLRAVALSLEARDPGARVMAHTVLKRRAQPPVYAPTLLGAVPSAPVVLSRRGLDATFGNAFAAALALTGAGERTAKAIQRLQRQDVQRLFAGEVAMVVTRDDVRRPTVTLLAPARDEAAAQRTLAEVPKDAGLATAVFDGKVAVATGQAGIDAVRARSRPLEDAAAFEKVLGGRPRQVGSLGFIDFRQLLELGEQTGLNEDRSYLAARDDLRRVGAVGISSTGGEEESTAEILLSIP